MSESPVTYHKGDDPELVKAMERARETFAGFFNQVSLDFNRIVPALELACVKAPFSDTPEDPQAPVEQMWIDEVTFDGFDVIGKLLNHPNHLESVAAGDEVRVPLGRISDWILVQDGEVHGGHTIQVIRSRMGETELEAHDEAWGLAFEPPDTVLLPERNEDFEGVIASLIIDQIEKEPMAVHEVFDNGRTVLHLEALYGRTPCVEVLLRNGADPEARCDRGLTAREYAALLGWEEVVALLDEYGPGRE
ncbi:MAG: DUF2314 domain-containing protein [Pirellulaceae bacterium]